MEEVERLTRSSTASGRMKYVNRLIKAMKIGTSSTARKPPASDASYSTVKVKRDDGAPPPWQPHDSRS